MKDITPLLGFNYRSFPFSAPVVNINDSIWFVDCDGYRVVGHGWGIPLYRFPLNSKVEYRYVAVSLRLGGFVQQYEIAAAFGHSVESQRRWEKSYLRNGIDGLQPKKPTGRPRKITAVQYAYIEEWFKEGKSNYEIGRLLGFSEKTIRAALKRMGLSRQEIKVTEPPQLFTEDIDGETTNTTKAEKADDLEKEDSENGAQEKSETMPKDLAAERETHFESPILDPMDRSFDRLMAALGFLDDAQPAFAEIDHLPRAGVLLAIPLLNQSETINIFQRIYGSIGPAFYGLRTTVVCLFFMALLRIKRPENFDLPPPAVGRRLARFFLKIFIAKRVTAPQSKTMIIMSQSRPGWGCKQFPGLTDILVFYPQKFCLIRVLVSII